LMVIVEIDEGIVAQPAIALHRCHIEKFLHVRRLGAHRFTRHPAQLLASHMGPPLFAQPPPATEMTKVSHRKIGTADRENVDVAERRADDAERLLDRQVGIAAVALDAGQALKLDGRLQLVVDQYCGNRVVRTVMNGENEFWHGWNEGSGNPGSGW